MCTAQPVVDAVEPHVPVTQPGLLINRNFALLWSGQSISVVGDIVFSTTLMLWIAAQLAKGQAWAPFAVSGLLLATSIPTFVVGPLAGVFVDRWDKRHTMLWMDAARAALMLSLAPVLGRLSPGWQLGVVYGVVVLVTICGQLFTPARITLIGDIVAEPHRARASGLEQVTTNLAGAIAPPLAVPLLFGLGVQWAVAVNALSFVLSFLAIHAIQVPRVDVPTVTGQQGHILREFGAGLRLFIDNRLLGMLLITAALTSLGSGAISALEVFFVIQNLHAPAGVYGLLLTAYGVGAVAGASLAGLFAQRFGVARTFWLSLLVFGLLEVAFARVTSVAPALVIMFLLGVPQGTVTVALMPLLLHATPRAFLGRVTAVLVPTISLAQMVSIVIAGYLDGRLLQHFHATLFGLTLGPIDVILSGAGVLIVFGGVYALLTLRSVYR